MASVRHRFVYSMICLAVHSAGAADFSWTGAGGDTLFGNEDNWSGTEEGVPGASDLAIFGAAGESLVTFGGDHTTDRVRFGPLADGDVAGTVMLNLGGYTYTATNGGAGDMLRPSAANTPRTLTIRNGELSVGGANYWGHDGNSSAADNGEVIIRIEQGGKLTLTGTSNSIIWQNRAANTIYASAFVEEGSTLYVNGGALDIGAVGSVDSAADVTVRGLGASLLADTSNDRNVISVGRGVSGTLSILDGGSLVSTRAINVALSSGRSGRLTVSGGYLDGETSEFTASSVVGNQLYIGGGRTRDRDANLPAPGGEGLAEFLDGGSGTFATLVNYYNGDTGEKGTLRIDGGFVGITGTGTFHEGSVVDLGLRSADQDILLVANNLILGSTLLLTIDENFSATLSDDIFLIQYNSLTGSFAGLAEGDSIIVDGYAFTIHYAMGENSNIIGLSLTTIPEPGHVALAAGLLVALLAVRVRNS